MIAIVVDYIIQGFLNSTWHTLITFLLHVELIHIKNYKYTRIKQFIIVQN